MGIANRITAPPVLPNILSLKRKDRYQRYQPLKMFLLSGVTQFARRGFRSGSRKMFIALTAPAGS
jgi:hypothetical protein